MLCICSLHICLLNRDWPIIRLPPADRNDGGVGSRFRIDGKMTSPASTGFALIAGASSGVLGSIEESFLGMRPAGALRSRSESASESDSDSDTTDAVSAALAAQRVQFERELAAQYSRLQVLLRRGWATSAFIISAIAYVVKFPQPLRNDALRSSCVLNE